MKRRLYLAPLGRRLCRGEKILLLSLGFDWGTVETFFGRLSPEAKESVLRSLSCVPASSKWRNLVEPCDVLWALDPANPLSAVAGTAFTKMASELDCEGASPKDLDESAVLLEKHWEIIEFGYLAGKSLSSLTFGAFGEKPSQAFQTAIVWSLESKCVSLRCLNITRIKGNNLAERVLRATRERLLKLAARGTHTPGIEKHCAGLHELHLAAHPNDTSFLRVTGPTLKMLRIEW